MEKREFPTNKLEIEAIFKDLSLDTNRINYSALIEEILNTPFDIGEIIDKINEFMS